jgi:hypothetical protein
VFLGDDADIAKQPSALVRRFLSKIAHSESAVAMLPVRAQRQGVDTNNVGGYERVANDGKCVCAALERLEGRRDIFTTRRISNATVQG